MITLQFQSPLVPEGLTFLRLFIWLKMNYGYTGCTTTAVWYRSLKIWVLWKSKESFAKSNVYTLNNIG